MAESNLQRHVMEEAAKLDYFWPNHDASKIQQVLQGSGIESGTYILRSSGSVDPITRRFLTLSVRMEFEKAHSVNVCHFPVKIEKDENNKVNYSLTKNCPSITSLGQLVEHYHGKQVKGKTDRGECSAMIKQGLSFRNHMDKGVCTSTNNNTLPQVPARRISVENNSAKVAPKPSPRVMLPKGVSSDSLVIMDPSPLRPSPSTARLSDRNWAIYEDNPLFTSAEERLSTGTSSDTGSTLSASKNTYCHCGLPVRVTRLPENWSVHRSSEQETQDMLYFKDAEGRTAWALPPFVDNLCEEREYLKYGRLNVQCFRQYGKHLTYSPTSELSQFHNYGTYNSEYLLLKRS